jgi:hypothetical protein
VCNGAIYAPSRDLARPTPMHYVPNKSRCDIVSVSMEYHQPDHAHRRRKKSCE